MKLRIERFGDTPQDFAVVLEDAWWDEVRASLPDLAGTRTRPEVVLRGHRMGDDLLLEGEIAGALRLGCGRCLNRYRHALREPFRLVLEPAAGRVPAEPQAAAALARDGLCTGDELESGWFLGSEIDLGAFLREVVALALPVQPVCRDDCRGLCADCGADRNIETCDCDARRRSAPFAVLGQLRERLERGEG